MDVDAIGGYELEVIDTSALTSSAREMRARELVDELVRQRIDVATGPLFTTRVLIMGENEHVLVIAMDHMISDGASLGILLRELWTLYTQSAQRLPLSLPDLPLQFADYAVWQQRMLPVWLSEHGAYWRKRLDGAERLELFQHSGQTDARVRVASLRFQIRADVRAGLRELARRELTTMVMSALTAYVA